MRLTTKFEGYGYVVDYDKQTAFTCLGNHGESFISGDAINKLGQLEDIEEELGIDLITLFKALKNGVYYKHYLTGEIMYDKGDYNVISLYINAINISLDDGWFTFLYKDYGKTWALTKEELL